MNALVELNLAAILFAPWFAILAVLYWRYPRQPRPSWRATFDAAALGVSVAVFVLSLYWAQGWADAGYGRMWQQIVGTSVSYGAFLAALGIAFWFRRRLFLRSIAFPGRTRPGRTRS
jgi:hypothetical protein